MKNNKFVIILVVLLFMFFAFGSGSSSGKESSSNSKKPSNVSSDTTDSISKPSESNTKKELPKIEEAVLLEQDGIRITAKEIVDESVWGQGIKMLIENESSNDVIVTANAMAVNGYMLTDFLYETVTAGAKANTIVHCFNTELENAGIENIEEVAFWFSFVNPSTYMTTYSSDEPIIIRTSAYTGSNAEIFTDGVEVVNQNDIRIVVKYVDEKSIWGTSVLIYVENNSSKNIALSADNISVNGFMIDGFYYADIKAGYKSFDDMTIFKSSLEENDITKIENIKMTFNCYDSDSYRTIFESDYVTITVN